MTKSWRTQCWQPNNSSRGHRELERSKSKHCNLFWLLKEDPEDLAGPSITIGLWSCVSKTNRQKFASICELGSRTPGSGVAEGQMVIKDRVRRLCGNRDQIWVMVARWLYCINAQIKQLRHYTRASYNHCTSKCSNGHRRICINFTTMWLRRPWRPS